MVLNAHPSAPCVLLAGGGTVGHLAPGFALAEALAERGFDIRFATPGEAEEERWFARGGWDRILLPAARRPRGLLAVPGFGARIVGSVLRARAILARQRVSAVVALGGWPCFPGAAAACLLDLPLFFLASDHRAGAVVRRMAPFARRVYLAEASAATDLPEGKTRIVGPILRPAIGRGTRDPARFGLDPSRRTLLVVGGSKGAEGLNRRALEGLRDAIRRDPALAGRIQVLHSTGPRGDGIEEAYRALGVAHRVLPFIEAMEDAWCTADLALTRAGAVTCAEVAATGTAALFVPYPHHADRQQFRNAEPLVARGAALLLEEEALTPAAFARFVLPLLLDEQRLATMRSRARRDAGGGAAGVAEDLVRCLVREGTEPRPGRTPRE